LVFKRFWRFLAILLFRRFIVFFGVFTVLFAFCGVFQYFLAFSEFFKICGFFWRLFKNLSDFSAPLLFLAFLALRLRLRFHRLWLWAPGGRPSLAESGPGGRAAGP
jgi:hypothetical protein